MGLCTGCSLCWDAPLLAESLLTHHPSTHPVRPGAPSQWRQAHPLFTPTSFSLPWPQPWCTAGLSVPEPHTRGPPRAGTVTLFTHVSILQAKSQPDRNLIPESVWMCGLNWMRTLSVFKSRVGQRGQRVWWCSLWTIRGSGGNVFPQLPPRNCFPVGSAIKLLKVPAMCQLCKL